MVGFGQKLVTNLQQRRLSMHRQNSYSAPSESDQSLAELLTLTHTVDEVGTKRYRNSRGDLHRSHGAAVIYTDGTEYWYQDGLRHSTYGPAVIYADGLSFWYLHGDRMSESEWEWKRAVDIMNACGQSPDE